MTNENNSDQIIEHARQIGRRLREGREARGLSVKQVADHQKLTSWYIEKIELGELEGLAAPVYLKGFIRRYGILVDVDCDRLLGMLDESQQPSPLPAEGVTSAPIRKAIYARAATVVAGTAMVVAPLIWWANHNNRDWSLKGMADKPAIESTSAQEPVIKTQDQPPVAASLQPMPTIPPSDVIIDDSDAPALAEAEAASLDAEASTELASSTRTFVIQTNGEAWVELRAGDQRLEYNLLQPGTQRSYQFEGELSARIGNVDAVEVELDGSPFDLQAHSRDNVAVFSVEPSPEVQSELQNQSG